MVRALEAKGYVGSQDLRKHLSVLSGGDRRGVFPLARLAVSSASYFENSYLGAVSALVEEEKISVEDLRELIDRIENQNRR